MILRKARIIADRSRCGCDKIEAKHSITEQRIRKDALSLGELSRVLLHDGVWTSEFRQLQMLLILAADEEFKQISVWI